ncbi:archease [Natronosalvus halobius]|uniref:archease n=1 Tax=Natronosalvus halobius TaxID=2953746 RepID=UPI0020A07400|nr:archease [Natronosalvus halobius]USZ71732.1 archease [Natronosalvus halobius]
MSYELRAHTADVAVAARGDTLETTVAAVADGLAAASCDEIPGGDADKASSDVDSDSSGDSGESDDRFTLEVRAESREALLFEYLDELIYLRDVRLELPVDNRVRTLERVDEDTGDESEGAGTGDEGAIEEPASRDRHTDDRWRLAADARGVPLTEIDAREVKAVTYSEMRLDAVDDGWEAYVVFDV